MHKYFFIIVLLFLTAINGFSQKVFISTDSTATISLDIGEVVISASKDNSELKKLPTSVSLITSNLIESNEIQSLNHVTGMAANFVMPDYGSKLTSPVYIRGIGSRINSPSVGLYVDKVPYFEKAAFDFDFFDVEKVEILRGPQGTLYGRNSMGGLINVVTKSPMDYQGSYVGLSAANYGNYKINASHYNKVGENMAFSFSGNYQHNDGFYTNEFLNAQVDESDSYGLRNRIIFKPNSNLTIENIANFEHSQQGGYPYAIFNDSLDRAEAISYNQASSYDRKMFSDGLNLTYSGNNWELTNTLSYQLLDDIQKIDQDFTADSMFFVDQLMEQHMLANELIVRSTGDTRYTWLVGAFGFKQFFDKSVIVDFYIRDMWYVKNYDLEVSSFALFHQSSFKINDYLTIAAGIRYDIEQAALQYSYNGEMGGNPLPVTDTAYPELTDNVILPKVSLTYAINNMTFYGSYTTGYKPGGFNSTFEKPEHLKFKHENSHNFELGYKASMFQGAIYGDMAFFYTKLENQQIYRNVPSGRGSYLDNAGESENKGFELALKSRDYYGLSGMASYGYTHSQILEYQKDSNVIYNNNYTPYIPRHTFAVQVNYTKNVNNNDFIDKVKVNLAYNQQGTLYWDLENEYKEYTYGLLNTKVSFIRKGIQVDLWGRNLLNSDYRSFLFQALGNTYVQKGKPLQVGMNLSFKF